MPVNKPSNISYRAFARLINKKFGFIERQGGKHLVMVIPGRGGYASVPRKTINAGMLDYLIHQISRVVGRDEEEIVEIFFG